MIVKSARHNVSTTVSMALIAALFSSVSGMSAALSVQRDREVSDKDVTNAVESQFWIDEAIDANSLDTRTRDGVVTLTGTVNTILARERAEQIAESIVGVRGIVNRIQVKPSVIRSDSEIRDAVEEALDRDPAAESYEVEVAVKKGTVTLTGTVDSWQEKQLCGTVAKGVQGVREARNEIDVEYKATRPDGEIEQEVKARLENDVLVDDLLIDVSVENGKVTLTGTVGSLAEKGRAQRDGWVAGVESVDTSDLDVEWWARDGMRRYAAAASRSDEQIEKAVRDTFRYDPRVPSFRPTIDVEDGSVTLRGIVEDLEAKRAAEEDARNVTGVWRVKNHLKVRPTTIPSNETLENRVARALRTDAFVDRWEIRVDAYSGTVYLSGKVSSSFEKARAEKVAEGVKGVIDVVSTIDHEEIWSWKRDQEIREDVRDQLAFSPFVDEDEVRVTVDNGVVTLTGEVDTWSERDAAEQNALEGGAKDVQNKLTVRYRFDGPYYGDNYGSLYGP